MLAVKDLAECRTLFLQITVCVFEFQTNFGFSNTQFPIYSGFLDQQANVWYNQ